MAGKPYPNLFSPLQIGTVTVKNRIALAPMSYTQRSPDGGFAEENLRYIEEVAKGGTGLITMGESIVGSGEGPCGGKTHVDIVMLTAPDNRRSLWRLADIAHRYNAKLSVEVSHGGVFSPVQFNHGMPPMGPNKYENNQGFNRGDGSIVHEMDEHDMSIVADNFADTIAVLRESGFDLAQIHMGHGWLLHQFLSPLFNHRTDEYGGSLENRLRFPMMVLDRIRAKVGRDFPLDIRISGFEVLPGGMMPEDVAQIAKALEPKVDMISVSCGGVYHSSTAERMAPSMFMPEGVNVYLAEAVKKSGMNIPVSTVGALSNPAYMEQIIASGTADLCNIAHGLICDPYLPYKAMHGRDEDILPCLRCNNCQDSLCRQPQKLVRCAINPRAGLEGQPGLDPNVPAKESKKVLIAGGGPAGMEAALTASKRGHQVILCEKADRLGGTLNIADTVSFKDRMKLYKDRMARHVLEDKNIEVRLNCEVTPELVEEIQPDAMFAAIGAVPAVPPIPGLDGPNVITGKDVHGREAEVGQNVVIIGGGLVGAETGIHLLELGKSVTIVEMTGDIAKDCAGSHHEACLSRLKDAAILTGAVCTRVTESAVYAQKDGQELELAADTVILAAGMKALTKEAYALGRNVIDFAVIGDAVKPGKILEATSTGFFEAMNL